MIYDDPEIVEKECVKERYPHSTAKIQIMQHCAAISAIPELSFFVEVVVARSNCLNPIANV